MTEAKHTPGPWKVIMGGIVGDGGFAIGSHITNGVVCERWPCTCDNDDRQRMIMDAKLIAAAPEMLEALQYVLSGISRIPDDVMDTIINAIRKATQ